MARHTIPQLAPKINAAYFPEVSAYPYDPDKAKELLEEAGYASDELELIGEAGRWPKDKKLIEAVAGQLDQPLSEIRPMIQRPPVQPLPIVILAKPEDI